MNMAPAVLPTLHRSFFQKGDGETAKKDTGASTAENSGQNNVQGAGTQTERPDGISEQIPTEAKTAAQI